MKKVKGWICKVLVGVMTVLCFAGNGSLLYSQAAEETISTFGKTENDDSEIYYVALGDSLTTGNGTSIPYVSEVSDYLANRYGNCVTKNLAVDGWKSGDLLNALTNPANSKYSSYREMVSKADIITLDIGTNDIYMTMMEVITNRLGCTIEQYGVTAEYWEKRYLNEKGISRLLLYMQLYSIVSDVTYELKYGDSLPDAISEFEGNYRKLLSEIKSLAPQAKVYAGNLFNVFVGVEPISYGSYVIVDIRELMNANVLKINEIIEDNANGNRVVDIYSVMNNKNYVRGIVEYNYYYDPHPTQAGQDVIADQYIAAIISGQ